MAVTLGDFINSILGVFSRSNSKGDTSTNLRSLLQRSGEYRNIVQQALLGDASLASDASTAWSMIPSFNYNKSYGNGLLSLSAKYDNQASDPLLTFGASIKPPTSGIVADIAGEAGQWHRLYNAAAALTPKMRTANVASYGLNQLLDDMG